MTVVHFWPEQLIHVRTDPGLRRRFFTADIKGPHLSCFTVGTAHEAGQQALRARPDRDYLKCPQIVRYLPPKDDD